MLHAETSLDLKPTIYLNFINLLNPSTIMGSGVYSASTITECKRQIKQCFLGVECGRYVRLKTSPQSMSQLSTHFGILNITTLYACTACYDARSTFYM
jgi:hypothetical protein